MVRVLIKTLEGRMYLTNNLRLFKKIPNIKKLPSYVLTTFNFSYEKINRHRTFDLVKLSPLGAIYEERCINGVDGVDDDMVSAA